MDVLREEVRVSRKDHRCSACNAIMPKGSRVRTVTVANEGTVYDWRTCNACDVLLTKHRDRFVNDGCFDQGCVFEELKEGQTVVDLLWELDGQPDYEFDKIVT